MAAVPLSGARILPVISMGNFDASFVPTVNDFGKLDPRFRLPHGTWDKLPQYRNYGFTVFKLKSGVHTVHPMAFSFPSADSKKLFFPTVHIHDGLVHAKADFDHMLYCQRLPHDTFSSAQRGWQESPLLAGSHIDSNRSKGLIHLDAHIYRTSMYGNLPNSDTRLC